MRPAHSLRTVSRRRVSGLDIRDGDDGLKASSPVSPPSPITEVDLPQTRSQTVGAS